jgi:O2-independent ubiquinone biosynthesis protein UbiV
METNLTLGPIPFHWTVEAKRDFYARIADEAPVETVYLGEVICSKRAPFFEAEIPGVIERLQRGGKRVVLSSLAEVMLVRERKATADLMTMEGIEVEINNAAGLLHIGGRPHRLGQFMNGYNAETLDHLARRGATHVCLPPELPGASVALIADAAASTQLGVEVQVFGRVPLAISARCYHARAHGRTKDNCLFVCEEDSDGMPLSTCDGKPFLRINGVQTLSESYLCVLHEIEALAEMGVGHLRLSPQSGDMVEVARIFRDCIAGTISANEAESRIRSLFPDTGLSNGFFHGAPGYKQVAPAAGNPV